MSEPTRKEVRKELSECAEFHEAMCTFGSTNRAVNAKDAAIIRSMANQPGGILLHDGSEKGRGTGLGLRPGTLVRTLREAVDGRRGVTPTTLHRSKDA